MHAMKIVVVEEVETLYQDIGSVNTLCAVNQDRVSVIEGNIPASSASRTDNRTLWRISSRHSDYALQVKELQHRTDAAQAHIDGVIQQASDTSAALHDLQQQLNTQTSTNHAQDSQINHLTGELDHCKQQILEDLESNIDELCEQVNTTEEKVRTVLGFVLSRKWDESGGDVTLKHLTYRYMACQNLNEELPAGCASEIDLVFVLDESGSVGAANFEMVKTFVQDVITEALELLVSDVFTEANGDRPDVPNVAVIITDGNSGTDVTGPAQNARDAGIKLLAVGVGSGIDTSELNLIASDPDSENVFQVDDFVVLNDTLKNLWTTICSITGYWFGASDETTEGTFQRLSDGEDIDFTDWKLGQPNGGVNENCAEIRFAEDFDGQWNDRDCEDNNLFFCEFT
nr:hypothetical protein BaRGS_019039 [Batillaria attramentaria]